MKDEFCEASGDDKTTPGGRRPYGYDQGRFIGPHEDEATPEELEYARRVQDTLQWVRERRARERRLSRGRCRTR